jgi:hypothetical protein
MKSTLLSCALALAAVAANWQSVKVYESAARTTQISLDGAGFIVLFCIVALVFLSRGLYKQIRHCLDQGIRIPHQARFIQFWPCFLLVPLLVRWSSSYSETTPEGARLTHSYGYGSDLSAYALLLCVLTIIVFQFYKGVAQFIENPQKAEPCG